MIIAKQNKLLKQNINGIPFSIILIKHKIKKGKGINEFLEDFKKQMNINNF